MLNVHAGRQGSFERLQGEEFAEAPSTVHKAALGSVGMQFACLEAWSSDPTSAHSAEVLIGPEFRAADGTSGICAVQAPASIVMLGHMQRAQPLCTELTACNRRAPGLKGVRGLQSHCVQLLACVAQVLRCRSNSHASHSAIAAACRQPGAQPPGVGGAALLCAHIWRSQGV